MTQLAHMDACFLHEFPGADLVFQTRADSASLAAIILVSVPKPSGIRVTSSRPLSSSAGMSPPLAAPVDVTVRSQFGLIGVRGTRFFAGPSRG
ncbi:MAG: hypothetical protein M1823_007051, partial [Watsoniomyces obsoletus]